MAAIVCVLAMRAAAAAEEDAQEHWAWQPVVKAPVPEVNDRRWALGAIDRFVLARLEAAGLRPAEPAPAHVLVRRMYLDLVGLPPTPEQVGAFVEAARRDRPLAVEMLADELLASPYYGQCWGRHWLDVARYSDGFGGFLDSAGLPDAWRYRDWVVDALNRDVPYDRFVKLQIAGDLIGEKYDAIATGFFALGPTYHSDGGDPGSVAQAMSETLDDRMDTLGRGLMAVTLSCARCHDHKFDPVPQQDYYSLAGIFKNTQNREFPLAPDAVVQAYNEHQQRIAQVKQRIVELENKAKAVKLSDEQAEQLTLLRRELERLTSNAPRKYDVAHALAEAGNADMPVAIRGNLRTPGEAAPRRFLKVLAGEDRPHFTRGSGRIELADAVAGQNNPLTARVIVNRIWMHHFGRALVASPSNFGRLGQKPSHPALLDWLAATLMEHQWSLKRLHRLIVTSATYQMSSRFNARAFAADGDNTLLWRMSPRRMDVEAWRDSLLAVTGELDPALGGPPAEEITASNRRTLYAKVSRNGDRFASDAFLRLFDFPLMRASVAKRPVSTVPQQFLFLMNSPFVVARAKALAARLDREVDTTEQRIDRAYRLLFGRAVTDEELQVGLQFLGGEAAAGAGLSPWEQFVQVLICSNEFMYVR